MAPDDTSPMPGDAPPEPRVGELAELYLGNILFAIESTALALDAESKPEDAAFYRGIGRALADAHGRTRGGARPT